MREDTPHTLQTWTSTAPSSRRLVIGVRVSRSTVQGFVVQRMPGLRDQDRSGFRGAAHVGVLGSERSAGQD
jgi:hypothetical protein